MSIANQLEDKIMNLVLTNTSFAAITTVYGALHTGDPGETATANLLASHAWMPVVFNAAASATSVNATTITWTCSATGTITYLSLHKTSTTEATNALWSGALTASKVVANVGDQVQAASDRIPVDHHIMLDQLTKNTILEVINDVVSGQHL